MKLVPFSSEHLQLDASLPVGVRDAAGQLLLPAGARIDTVQRLRSLQAQPLYADESESQEWRRRLVMAMGSVLRRNAPLKALAEVRPRAERCASAAPVAAAVPEAWEGLCLQLDAALRDAPDDPAWLGRADAIATQARQLGCRHTDASLYHLVRNCAENEQRYSARHGLLVLLVCEHAATLLGWAEPVLATLARAALTMNVAMAGLQDLLAASAQPPTASMRAQIAAHADTGARWLQAAGADAEWCAAVRLHHRADVEISRRGGVAGTGQIAQLLRRADIFTAKISARKSRAPMSPVQAAREACLGGDGRPDEVGGALLRAVGLYPPGSFVELANGERGIVVARGRRANLPCVASLVGPSGFALGEPALRDTIDARYAVRAAISAAQVKVHLDHDRIHALR